jgi:very-short-patch-repair endonuclease
MLCGVDDWETQVTELLARQDGVIGRQQALRAGMTPGQVRRRLDTGRWLTLHAGVYRSAQHPSTDSSRVRAALLWGGKKAFLAGHAAAWWWGLTPTPPLVVDIVIPPREHRRSRSGIQVTRRLLDYRDTALLRGAQVTALPMATLMGSVALGRDGPALLDHALQKRISYDKVRAAYYRNIGFAGNERAGELLRAAADKSAAVSERIFIKLLKDAGIHGWRVNYSWDPADKRSIDVAFVREMIAIEIDGWAWHHTPDRFQRDRNKQNDLTDLGWIVRRFTWFDLTQNPDDVIRRVKADLARANTG